MPDVYLDVCCFNRPYDDQTQDRIRLEAEAVLLILRRVEAGDWRFTVSEAVTQEIDEIPDSERRERILALLHPAYRVMPIRVRQIERAEQLEQVSFRFLDAVHVACAEDAAVDVLLTTDDRLIKAARRQGEHVLVRVANPLLWLAEETEK